MKQQLAEELLLLVEILFVLQPVELLEYTLEVGLHRAYPACHVKRPTAAVILEPLQDVEAAVIQGHQPPCASERMRLASLRHMPACQRPAKFRARLDAIELEKRRVRANLSCREKFGHGCGCFRQLSEYCPRSSCWRVSSQRRPSPKTSAQVSCVNSMSSTGTHRSLR